MKKLLLLFILTSFSAYADTKMAESFCKAYFEQKAEKKPLEVTGKKPRVFKFVFKFMFNPKSLVEIEPLKEADFENLEKEKSETRILFNLLSETIMTKDEKKKHKALKKEVKRNRAALKKEKLYENLKAFSLKEECIDYISTPRVTELLEKFEADYASYAPLSAKRSDELSAKLIKKNLKSFKRRGWKVFSSLSINEVYNEILRNPRSTVLVVGHATPKGEVVDGELNILPASFFRNTQVENLILYTCYPDEVAEFYNVLGNKNIINYYLPRLNEVADGILDSSKTPMNSLRKVLKTNFYATNSTYLENECSLTFRNNNEVMGVFLNKTYLGTLKENISFDCALLKDKNNLEVYSMTKEGLKGSLGIETFSLNNREQIQASEFVSKVTKKHIVTKASF